MSRPSVIAILVCAFVGAACSKQGEGERCDTSSGTFDCESGLICRSTAQGEREALCCPADESQTTVDACRSGAQLPPENDPPLMPVDDAGAGDAGP